MRRGYIFTDKKESKRGLFSAALGLMSLVSLLLAVWLTFQNGGEALIRYGVVGLLCLIFSAVGLVCGILGKTEEDKFHLSAWIGIVLNALTVLGVGFILYAGVNG